MKLKFAGIFSTKTREEWTHVFEGVDACVTPVLSPLEAVHHPLNKSRHVFTDAGKVQPQPAPRFSKTPGSIKYVPEDPVAAAREGLYKWGIDDDQFATLQAEGVLR